jgi:putative NADH-flavin reductase
MAHVLVVGASNGIGLETVKAALAAGYRMRAFARSAAEIELSDTNLERFSGDALKASDVEAALVGVDAVVQALGCRSVKGAAEGLIGAALRGRT